MARPGLVDRRELLRWADSQEARGEFPRLIRKLILETGGKIVQLGFPAGEGVDLAGWDGTVRARESTTFIPAGLSLWELSVHRRPGAKADGDYRKRLRAPGDSPTEEFTYVAAALRPWQKRASWAQERISDRRWKDVLAYGVDDIETWLETAPVTHAWLSELLGHLPYGLITGENWWGKWSRATKPVFPFTAVLAGREEEARRLKEVLWQSGRIITLRGSSREDVLAFIGALGAAEAAEDGGALMARMAVVDDVATWRRLQGHRTPLLLIAGSPQVIEEVASGTAHHLIVPDVGSGPADISLPPPDAERARDALAAIGVDKRQAEEVGKLARMSLLAARRRIANKPELHKPRWATRPIERLVRRILLAGRWNEHSAGDLQELESLLGEDYDSVRERLSALVREEDPLVSRFGPALGAVSEFDAWLLVGGEFREDDLRVFEESALKVLGERDPRVDMPANERWSAALRGETHAYSHEMRLGLATSLALLGWRGSTEIEGSSATTEEWAARIVRLLFEKANRGDSCGLWASLSDVLPLLAESAPSEFLEAVREGASGDDASLRLMFRDKKDESTFFSDSPHTGLLWALETLAWSPTHFGQAVDLLARLHEIDPGGQLLNRPMESLERIFCPWFPQNSVTLNRRLEALDGLRARHESAGWQLMVSMLPGRGITSPISAPRFRDWKRVHKERMTQSDYRSFLDEVVSRLLDAVGSKSSRWVSLLWKLPELTSEASEATLEKLETLSTGTEIDDASRAEIWETLRGINVRYQESGLGGPEFSDGVLKQLKELERAFEPSNPGRRHAWLFDNHMPQISGISYADHREYDIELDRLRVDAAREIVSSLTWPEIRSYGLKRKVPQALGAGLARAGLTEYERYILDLLGSQEVAGVELASAYAWQRFRGAGWLWVEDILADEKWSAEQSARLLLSTRDFPRAWEVAEDSGLQVRKAFWREFQSVGLGGDFLHVEKVAGNLLEVNRPGEALHLLALYRRQERGPERADLMATGLEELLRFAPEHPNWKNLSSYTIQEIFSCLEGSGLPEERLARLVWAYLPLVEQSSIAETLGRFLAEDPVFFADAVSAVYRPRHRDEPEEEDERVSEEANAGQGERQAVASNAFRLLSEWRVTPGLRDDGTIDAEMLRTWVEQVRSELRERDRLQAGDMHIGMMLSSSPAESDGSWPCVAVRDLMEIVQSKDIESSLCSAVYNNRGATVRGMLEGGKQERDLAAEFRKKAERFVDRWPRTAAVLNELARMYESSARHYDQDAERRRTGFEK